MKLIKALSISLAAAVSAATICVGTAFAAEQPAPTVYPDSFECSLSFEGGLTDYAIYGDTYAFAYNGQLAVLNGNGNNERLPDVRPVSSITQLDFSADGKLYVCFADGYCTYPDLENKLPLSQAEVQGEQNLVTIDDVRYIWDKKDGALYCLPGGGGMESVKIKEAETAEVKFAKLKKYDNTAYAVANNTLYKLEGATAVKVEPTYYGYIDKTKAISTGDAAEALKAQGQITMGWIEKGKYYTEINLNNGLGATFEIVNPATATTLSEDRLYCMVLAESGNASIVTMNGKCYLTAKTSVSLEVEKPALGTPDSAAAYAVEKTGVYSRPYLSAATKLCDLESGSVNAVTVLGQFTDLAGNEYYKVTYTSQGKTVTGYTAKGLMTGYAFPAEDNEIHTDGGDKEFVYDTNVVTVALAVAIVALVIIAVLYVASASSKKKRKKKKKAVKKTTDDDDDEEDEE